MPRKPAPDAEKATVPAVAEERHQRGGHGRTQWSLGDDATGPDPHRENLRAIGAVYFARPHSPWQRGSNENANHILCEFPKGDPITSGPNDLAMATPEINDRPRKIHN